MKAQQNKEREPLRSEPKDTGEEKPKEHDAEERRWPLLVGATARGEVAARTGVVTGG